MSSELEVRHLRVRSSCISLRAAETHSFNAVSGATVSCIMLRSIVWHSSDVVTYWTLSLVGNCRLSTPTSLSLSNSEMRTAFPRSMHARLPRRPQRFSG